MIEKIQSLGFTRKESRIYVAALKLGAGYPASVIANRAGINRTTAYDVLESLCTKGVIVSYKQKNSMVFEALPPEKLVNYLKEKSTEYIKLAENAELLLPELNTQYNVSGKPKIYFYEGDEGLIRVYEETLQSKEEILAYASDQSNQEAIPWYFPEYYKRRAAKKISIRALFPDTPQDRIRHQLDKKELRRSRLLPKNKLDFTPEVNFFDNKIMIADWNEKLGIIIESEEIAKVFKQTFELAWEAAEKYHKEIAKKLKPNSPKGKDLN